MFDNDIIIFNYENKMFKTSVKYILYSVVKRLLRIVKTHTFTCYEYFYIDIHCRINKINF